MGDVFVDVVVLHLQLVEVCGGSIGLICVCPGLDEFFFEIVVDCSIWSGRSRNGQDPVFRASFPFVNVWATHISEGVGDFLPWIDYHWVRGVHELIKGKLVKEVVGRLSISFEGRRFFPLERFVVSLNQVR